MRCTGPYTRVFLDKKDARQCRALLEAMESKGLALSHVKVPEGRGHSEDFVFSVEVRETDHAGIAWKLGLAKFLGPKKLFRQSHVYEATLTRIGPEGSPPWQGHLFDAKPAPLFDRLLADWPRLAAGESVDGLFERDEAHEERILLCNA